MVGVTALITVLAALVAQTSGQICATGYYLSQSGRGAACQPCPSPCETCTSYGICTSCVSGRASGSAPSCPLCPPGCLTCSYSSVYQNTTCLTCQQGLFLYKGGCWACNSSQYMLSGVCKTCPTTGATASCKKCLNATACVYCDSGSTLGNWTFT